ncbi:MAG TPA: HAD-IA family hydrolase [Planctomycetia bacterium]|jgi:phosphoglycolate phosphatase|nr:HAD-IA family hydrolase [Planctomycetia bacterium]
MTSQRRPAVFLFDLDGTLCDSYRAIQASVNHVRGHRGLPPLELGLVRAAVGNGLVKLLERTVAAGDPEEYARLFLAHHPGALQAGTDVLPGVAATLASLQARGDRLGVCSNKPLALTRELLAVMKLDAFFGAVVGPESAPRPKPAPDMLLVAMRELDAEPARTLYVGDMTIDVEAGRAAGLAVWVIPSGSHDRAKLADAAPDRILADFAEVLSFNPS